MNQNTAAVFGVVLAAIVVLMPQKVTAQSLPLGPHFTCAALAAEAANYGFDLGYGQLEPVEAVKHHANAVLRLIRNSSKADLGRLLELFDGYPANESWVAGYLFGAGLESSTKDIRSNWCFTNADEEHFNCIFTPFSNAYANWSEPYTEFVKQRYYQDNCALLPAD